MNEKLNIQSLTDLLAEKHRIPPQEAEDFVKTFFALIEEGLEQDRYVKIKGLGTFKLIEVESRGSVDVNTGERIEIQEHTKVSFTPDSALKEIINRPFGHFETVILNENTVLEDTLVEKEGEEEVENTTVASQPVEDKPTLVTDISSETKTVSDEPRQEEETSVISEKEEKNNRGIKWLVGALVGLLLICVGVVAYLYFPEAQRPAPALPTEQQELLSVPVQERETAQAPDTLVKEQDTVRGELPKKTVKDTSVKKAQPIIPDSVNYEIIGTMATYTVKEGETLTRVSLRFYGTKALWPYLVKHNQNVLKDPNHVTSGTVLSIPKLTKKQ